MDTGTRRPALALMLRRRLITAQRMSGGPGSRRHSLTAGVAVVLVSAMPWACSSATMQSAGGFRDANRSNVERLTPGMPRDQVVSTMGTQSLSRPLGTEGSGQARTERDSMGVTQIQFPTGSSAPALYNPMRTGTYEAGEHTWEVLFYYVRLAEDDGVVSDDELEPVVLRDGFLAGVGWSYWTEIARQEGIRFDLESPSPG